MTTVSDLARTIAAAFALGGVIMMMVQPAPSWTGVANGLFCLLVFLGFSLAGWLLSATRPTGNSEELAPAVSKPVAQDAIVKLPTQDPVKVRELLPSRLPELSTHIQRRRWRGRYRTE